MIKAQEQDTSYKLQNILGLILEPWALRNHFLSLQAP